MGVVTITGIKFQLLKINRFQRAAVKHYIYTFKSTVQHTKILYKEGSSQNLKKEKSKSHSRDFYHSDLRYYIGEEEFMKTFCIYAIFT